MGKPEDIIVDDAIWILIPERSNGSVRRWHDKNGVVMALNCIGFDQALHSRLGDETAARAYYRDSFAQEGMGVVQCHLSETNGQKCVKTIGKRMVPGKPGVYAASLAIPLAEESFVLTLFAQEVGVTGVRDTAIFTLMRTQGKDFAVDTETGKMKGWAQDPYFPDFDGPCLRNPSEAEEYDAAFPEHPLSRVRARFARLETEIGFSDELKARLAGKSEKPWWRLW